MSTFNILRRLTCFNAALFMGGRATEHAASGNHVWAALSIIAVVGNLYLAFSKS